MTKPLGRRTVIRSIAGMPLLTRALRLPAYARPLKVGIIGGGIVGASIARHLAVKGASVVVFEKNAPALGTTQNSFAWVNAFEDDTHYRSLRLQSLRAYRELDAPLRLGMIWGGYADWAADAAGAELVHANARQLADTPYPVRPLEAAQLTALCPALRPGTVSAAFYSAIDGHLDPVHVTHRFLDAAARSGALIQYPCEVQALELRGARLTAAVTTRGRVPLDRLVIAAGVDTPRLLAMCGFTLSLRHAPGILAHSIPTQPMTRLICDAPGGLSFKQMSDGSLVGTDATAPPPTPVHEAILARQGDFPDPTLRARHGARILGKIDSFLPIAGGITLERLTLGFRPLPMDGYPVVGALPGVPDIHVAVTHSGVTLAPIIGRYTANEVLGGTREAMLAPYRPERFSTG